MTYNVIFISQTTGVLSFRPFPSLGAALNFIDSHPTFCKLSREVLV
jgi:hypothetical protein